MMKVLGRNALIRGFNFCFLVSSMLLASVNVSAEKLRAGVGGASGTIAGGVSAEAARKALAAKGMTEDEFFQFIFSRGVPRIKQDLPKMLDADTQFYDVTGSGREWGYWYKFTRYASKDLNPAAVKKEFSPGIIAEVCSRPSMIRPFMEMGGTYRYNYVGKDNKFIVSVLVSWENCN